LSDLYGKLLVGGFNPFEKYESKWESSPIFGVKIKNVSKPPTSKLVGTSFWADGFFTPKKGGLPSTVKIQGSRERGGCQHDSCNEKKNPGWVSQTSREQCSRLRGKKNV